MVGKKSGKALLREEGLERTDNNLESTVWPQINPINQKNYYTEYLKRDDQFLVFRLQADDARNRMTKAARDHDRALAHSGGANVSFGNGDIELEDETVAEAAETVEDNDDESGSRVIVIHPGSQNLRIGLASDALPKIIPMVIARKWSDCECDEDGGEPRPKRLKLDHDVSQESEQIFGKEFGPQFAAMSADLKTRMRNNKRRVLPNSKELAVNYNKRTPPERISEHNDAQRVDWTELPADPTAAPDYVTGSDALRIPDWSNPRYKLFWPLRHGWFNERDYPNGRLLRSDVAMILEEAIKGQLGLESKRAWTQYSCVFVVPDLYERNYVTSTLDLLLREFGFARVCFIQESLAATFGAGYTSACIVDIGAQKTSICCVEEGMCLAESRLNLKYGGADVTETFVKMLLHDYFPYSDINLRRRYDFLLAEELKHKFCNMNDADISVQLCEFYLRAPGQETRKYTFKVYDEVMLAPMGFFNPSIFDLSEKLRGRRKLIDRSYDLYDGTPNDPLSAAQQIVYERLGSRSEGITDLATAETNGEITNGILLTPTSSREQADNVADPINDNHHPETTPRSSPTRSPPPEGSDTPQPGNHPPNIISASPVTALTPKSRKIAIAEERDRILPVMPLDEAILTSILYGAQSEEKRTRDFMGGIMVIGGGAQVPGFHGLLEERLKELRPAFARDIMIGNPPRELDPQVVVWKGGSVFGKLRGTNDSWISQMEFDRLGSRVLPYKCMWVW